MVVLHVLDHAVLLLNVSDADTSGGDVLHRLIAPDELGKLHDLCRRHADFAAVRERDVVDLLLPLAHFLRRIRLFCEVDDFLSVEGELLPSFCKSVEECLSRCTKPTERIVWCGIRPPDEAYQLCTVVRFRIADVLEMLHGVE